MTRALCVASAQVPKNKKMPTSALRSSGGVCRSLASACVHLPGGRYPLLLLHVSSLGSNPGHVQEPARRRLFREVALVRFDHAGPEARISSTLPAKKGPRPEAGLEVLARKRMMRQPDFQAR
ncbi:hypothetical protein NDU88_000722 [Pleurodeles waltl]|uniref:Uncharacterized protein n=1 Tax=Pleurodeles waltl TaxID=8319 RepID=A0AAV7U4T7_PLEWA|nr:hypothetical protein NDU88_000722 [Pleurodeles waltl]